MGYIEGIDVSRYQGDIDWQQVAEAGYGFAFVKATEGVGWQDPYFQTNAIGARDAGLYVGAYHFAYVKDRNLDPEDARREARYFADVAKGNGATGSGCLPPVLDLETWLERGDGPRLAQWALAWLREARELFGVWPIVYMGPNYWRGMMRSTTALRDRMLWEVDIVSGDAPKPMWRPWTFWQYTFEGKVPGIAGDCDVNRFALNQDALDVLASWDYSDPAMALAMYERTVPRMCRAVPPGFADALPVLDIGGNTPMGPDEAVERVQALLLAHGYGPDGLVDAHGLPDGIGGTKTLQHVMNFKTDRQLAGEPWVVDPGTWWALLTFGIGRPAWQTINEARAWAGMEPLTGIPIDIRQGSPQDDDEEG